jgi:hypothetical protein
MHALVNQGEWQTKDNSKCQVCCSFRSKQILQKPVVTIEGVQIQLYLLGDVAHHIRPYLFKGYKPRNSDMVDQIRFDQFMSKGCVMIENAFETLRN